MRPSSINPDDQKQILVKEAEKYFAQKLYRLSLKKYQKIIEIDANDSIAQNKINELNKLLRNQFSKEKKLVIISIVLILISVVVYVLIVNS